MSKDDETPEIDRSARKRSHVFKRVLGGLKNGLLWGGVGGLVAGGAIGLTEFAFGKMAIGSVLSSWLGVAAAGGSWLAGMWSPTTLIGGALGTVAASVIPVALAALAVGAVAGALWGGISAMSELDDVDKQVDMEIQRKKDLAVRNAREEQIMAGQYQQQAHAMSMQGQAAGFAPISGLPSGAMAKNDGPGRSGGGTFG